MKWSWMVASLRKRKRVRVIITKNGVASAVLLSPEELETLEILADTKLVISLLKRRRMNALNGWAKHEDIFK
jgi:PHD/YefM family antitoxin component YafN of YafNO toxin-antitoxin module